MLRAERGVAGETQRGGRLAKALYGVSSYMRCVSQWRFHDDRKALER